MSAIGIDFGTTNSVVATYTPSGAEAIETDSPPVDWADMGFGRVLPTVMAIADGDVPVFGWAAKTTPGERLEAVKRLFREEELVTLNGQTFVVEEVAAMLFAHLKQRAAEQGVDARQAVVTVPANSRGLARYRTKLTAGMAGLEVLALLNEPTAAAMAYSARMPFDQRIMVVDWGGGTLDVTVLQANDGIFIEQASKGIQQLGGMDLDNRIAQRVIAAVADAHTWSAAEKTLFRLEVEKAKIRLSSSEFTNIALPRGGNFRLERSQFEHDVRPLVEKVRHPIEQTLRDIGSDAGSIDSVILVGGTCKAPLVRTFIADILGKDPVTGVDPMTAVAEGAAIAAAILTGAAPDNDFFVSTEHALGTYVHSDGGPRAFSTIIPRNHKLPAAATETYFPVSPESVEVVLDVVEGDPGTSEEHPDNVVLKTWPVPLDPERSTVEDKAIEISYEYDVDGILHVSVRDGLTGLVILEDDVAFGISQDKRKLVQIASRAQAAVATGRLDSERSPNATEMDPATMELLQRARNKVIPFLDDHEAQEIRRLVAEVEASSPDSRTSAVGRLEAALAPFTYLF